jgi:hypothetical protein
MLLQYMKLHFGAVPEGPGLPPGKWQPLREPGPWGLNGLGLPVGLLICAGLTRLWLPVVQFQHMTALDMGWFVLALVLILPVHEFFHLAAHPDWGGNSILGIWPHRLVFYAHYTENISRGRLLLTLAMPLLAMTFAPLIVARTVMGHAPPLLMFVSVVNSAGAGGDIICLLLVWWQVPRGAVVRNHGWKSFWRYEDKTK